MRVLFAGTPEIAVPSLRVLAGSFDVAGVLTNPDRPAGRGRGLKPSPVKAAARELGLTVLQPERLDRPARESVAALRPDILVVVAYGRIFGPRFLGIFPLGGVNLHPSLLPLYRGPSPINAVILAGERETGISVQRLALEMDCGDILVQERMALNGRETAGALTEMCAQRGAILLERALRAIEDNTAAARPQAHAQASYCAMIDKGAGRIDWRMSAIHIDRMIRAYDPWPGAYTESPRGLLFLVEAEPLLAAEGSPEGRSRPGTVSAVDTRRGILIETGDGLLSVRRLRLQSRKTIDFLSFLNGYSDFVGSVLGSCGG